MKKILIFGLFFALGVATLAGGAILTTDILRAKNQNAPLPADTAFIEASTVEPASGAIPNSDVAKEGGESLMPSTALDSGTAVEDIDATHPLLRVTPDKTEMVELDRDASSIVVGNPAHASVMMENPRLLLVVPRNPGATHMTVLDKDGKVIMQRHIIVASPREKYVRIRRSCTNATGNRGGCEPISVYYCPDMCHEVSSDTNTGSRNR